MARLLVNKHFNEHESAKNGFSASEEYLFGEIVICNDSENPSIYIKDTEMNSVAIGDVLIESDDKILSKENRIIRSSIGLVWDETVESIKLIGNNGNIISSSAQITLEKDGAQCQGVAIGDGPIDAAFHAVEQITGTRFELDDFQIQSVTEGKEAMGSALVKLRSNGKLYSGNGISTDIIGASIRAYLSAVNKIVYEEA
jgi:2-isopropylmalate synthase